MVIMALTSRLLRCQSLMGFRALINPRFTGILSARQVSMIIKLSENLRRGRNAIFFFSEIVFDSIMTRIEVLKWLSVHFMKSACFI